MANRSNRSNDKRGFASMDDAQQREIASKGGQSQGKDNNPGNFANNPRRAHEAGMKGGRSQGKDNNPGNFANDPERARRAGEKGGKNSHGGGRQG